MEELHFDSRMYRGAYWGSLVGPYIVAGDARVPVNIRLAWGELVGLWLMAMISIDAALDFGSCDRSEAQSFLDHCLAVLERSENSSLTLPPFPLRGSEEQAKHSGSIALRLCAMVHQLRGQEEFHRSEGCSSQNVMDAFLHESARFLRGQMTGLQQRVWDDDRRWPWYWRTVVDQKNHCVFAPLVLGTGSKEAAARYALFLALFSSLNSAYVHWQLLDDIADIDEDCRCGIVGAPGYMLLSQGHVAARLLQSARMKPGGTPGRIQEASHIVHSSLLLPEDCGWLRQCDSGWRSESDLAFGALSNTREDDRIAIDALCDLRIVQAARFRAAMLKGDSGSAVKALTDSKVASRVVQVVADVRRARYCRAQLRAEGARLRATLSTIAGAMERTFRAACRVTGIQIACQGDKVSR
jgi:hypothetical protein